MWVWLPVQGGDIHLTGVQRSSSGGAEVSEWQSTPSRQVNHESEGKQRGRRGVERKSQPSFTTAAPECARSSDVDGGVGRSFGFSTRRFGGGEKRSGCALSSMR